MQGILGGTFDPPHIAHLVAAETAYRQLGLETITFLPAGAPWQKAGRVATSPEHRWAMTERSVAGIDYFTTDDREIHRDGWTYTIDTLESFPEDADLAFILGADAALGLPSWHRASDVLARARIVAVPRPGTDPALVDRTVGGSIEWLEMPSLAISGTRLRERAQRGGSLRFLVRDAVWEYIRQHRLYVGA